MPQIEPFDLRYVRFQPSTATGDATQPQQATATDPWTTVEGEGFEPSKAEPADLQSAPFDRSGTPP